MCVLFLHIDQKQCLFYVIPGKMNLFENELPLMQHVIYNLNITWNDQINVAD